MLLIRCQDKLGIYCFSHNCLNTLQPSGGAVPCHSEIQGSKLFTFTGLLSTLQAIAGCTHARASSLWGGEAELRAITIVHTARIGTFNRNKIMIKLILTGNFNLWLQQALLGQYNEMFINDTMLLYGYTVKVTEGSHTYLFYHTSKGDILLLL